jgi:hypothetical protein
MRSKRKQHHHYNKGQRSFHKPSFLITGCALSGLHSQPLMNLWKRQCLSSPTLNQEIKQRGV